MIYFLSDAHLGDDRFELLLRPFKDRDQYLNTIKNNWNSTVKPTDTVFILGDVCYTNNPELLPFYDTLNGKKHLILGNHDDQDISVYKKYFDIVQDSYIIETTQKDGEKTSDIKLFLNHYPSKGKVDYFNLCGHIHGSWRVQKNMINVSVDCWGFRPVSLEKILFLKKAIENFYDDDVWVGNHPANLAHKERGKKGTYYNK